MSEVSKNSLSMREKTRKLTMFSMFLTLELLLFLVPYLGYIPVGPINATTLHIPVILCAIFMGPAYGAGLGFVFGLSSLLKNTFMPTITSFVFSPFVEIGGLKGNGWSLWIAIGPRILLGVIAYYLFVALAKAIKKPGLAAGLAAALSTFIHTLMVMGSIYLFFGKEYAQARQVAESAVLGLIGGVIAVNGVAELIVSAILVFVVYQVSKGFMKKRKTNA